MSSRQLGVGILLQPSFLDLGNCPVPDNLCAWKIFVKQLFKAPWEDHPLEGSFGGQDPLGTAALDV